MFTFEQKINVTRAKLKLQTNIEYKLRIFGPYEKRMCDWFVSGGCIGSFLRDEVPNDIDIYFTKFDTMEHVSNLIQGSLDLMAHVKVAEEKYGSSIIEGRLVTLNAITMNNDLQFITRVSGSPDKIRSTFDYVHCMPYYSFEDRRLYISEEQYDCCVNKILKVNNETNVTDKRKQKFLLQGFKECQ
jgi:hypothetical protein